MTRSDASEQSTTVLPPRAGGPRPRTPRYRALDGLRGVAALVVVVFHVLVLSPPFADRPPGLRLDEASWWLTHTPLYLLWAGPEAVLLFFVLSGFVLALPATNGRVRWRGYYPARLVRLYLPVWASLVFAAGTAALVPRVPHPEWSGWYAAHVPDVGASEAVRDGLLLFGTGWLNSPLWSLQWELWFSLLLPVYVVVLARPGPRWGGVKAVGVLLVVAVAELLGQYQLAYLAMFGVGVLLAVERDRLARAAARVHSARAGQLLAALCVLLLTGPPVLRVLGLDSRAAAALGLSVQLIGAALAVTLALHWPPLRDRLTAEPVQWLGLRSFSLYLVHEPVTVSSAALWPGLPLVGHLLVVVPVSLVVAAAFYRLVEYPAHRLSRRAGRWGSARRTA